MSTASLSSTSRGMRADSELPDLKDKRLLSLDALRGFDMFWIIGADALVEGLQKLSSGGVVGHIATQLQHKRWEGIAFEDLIFPLFVFIVGVSLVFSLSKAIQQTGRAGAVRRVLFRAVALYVIGLYYYGGLSKRWPEDVRFVGVLQRIAISYFFAALIFLFFGLRSMIAITATLLLSYWVLMSFVPVPGVTPHSFEEGKNLANYIDFHYLPGRKWDTTHDPEGLLSAIPAIGTCLLGVFAGLLLRNEKVPPMRKVGYLLGAGVVAIALGWLWGLQFPIIKKIWTSSYVLVAAGYSAIILGLFYLVIDVWKYRLWAQPFVWIGMNAITLYLAEHFLSFTDLGQRFVGDETHQHLGRATDLAAAIMGLLLILLLARFLYRRKIFIRL